MSQENTTLGFGRFDTLIARNQHYGLATINENIKLSDADFYLKQWDVKECFATFHAANEEGNVEQLDIISGDKEVVTRKLYVPTEHGALGVSNTFSDSYTPVKNEKFLDLIKTSLDAAGLPDDVYSVGSLFNRKRVFVSIPLASAESFEVGERKFDSYLNFMNSFDGSTPFLANTTNICTVCSNSFAENLKSGGCLVKHTKNMSERLANLPAVIAEAVNNQGQFANDFMTLASVGVKRVEAELIIISTLAKLSKARKLSTVTNNKVQPIADLFTSGAGNKGETFADLFSAFTDYYSNVSANGNQARQFVSSNFGTGATYKMQVREMLLKMISSRDLIDQALDHGSELQKDYLLAQ